MTNASKLVGRHENAINVTTYYVNEPLLENALQYLLSDQQNAVSGNQQFVHSESDNSSTTYSRDDAQENQQMSEEERLSSQSFSARMDELRSNIPESIDPDLKAAIGVIWNTHDTVQAASCGIFRRLELYQLRHLVVVPDHQLRRRSLQRSGQAGDHGGCETGCEWPHPLVDSRCRQWVTRRCPAPSWSEWRGRSRDHS
jgi:hypothetical protein